MDNMIIVPINHEPLRCPKCNMVEDRIQICRNCKYEYKEDLNWWEWILFSLSVVIAVIVIIWFLITLLNWLVEGNPLMSILRSQLEWAKNIRIWEAR